MGLSILFPRDQQLWYYYYYLSNLFVTQKRHPIYPSSPDEASVRESNDNTQLRIIVIIIPQGPVHRLHHQLISYHSLTTSPTLPTQQ